MINKNSIFFTITITFLISILLVIISFKILYNSSEKREKFFSHKKNLNITKMILQEYRHNRLSQEFKDNLADMNIIFVTDKKRKMKILKNKNIVLEEKFKRRFFKIKYLRLHDRSLIYVTTKRDTILLENINKGEHHNFDNKNHQYTLFIIFATILLIFIVLYFFTINKLKPLKILKNQMKNFADEKFDVKLETNKKDEISQLANEFNNTALKLKNIKESRNVFIRNIMHELKTPITKGKFLTKLEKDEVNNIKMQKVFDRLESLINEFALIEELISNKKVIAKEYYLEDIVDEASDILMCDENTILKDIDNIKVNVDFKLFSIALKNLFDNGIKFSSNKQVSIITQGKNIIVQNQAKKLQYPLEHYFEAFFKGDDIKSNQSFGLGLYIVKHILDANYYRIKYEHNDGINKFILVPI